MSKTERALDELDTEFDDEFELELDMDAPDRALDRYDADDVDDDLDDDDLDDDDVDAELVDESEDIDDVHLDQDADDEADVDAAALHTDEIDELEAASVNGATEHVDEVDDEVLDDVDSTNGHHATEVEESGELEIAELTDESTELGELLVDTAVEVDDDADLDESDDDAVEGRTDSDVDTEVETEADLETVTDDILEELRRADIDGPVVEMAPQDAATSARRRPKRALDFDPAPVPIPTSAPLLLGRKPRVRKVTRVVRHVDPWSVFKIAAVANLVLYVILLTAGVLLWNVANATGTVDNVERFFESFGWNTFEFNGGEIYHSAWIGGLFLVVGLTGLAVLAATLFNLITDLVGGMRFTVLEEEVVETRTSPMRRFVVRRPEPVVPAVVHDDESGPMIREAVVDDESKGLPF